MMVQHDSLKEGMTVTRPFTVVKMNKKSMVIEDSQGNRETVRQRDYPHYFKGTQAKAINGYKTKNSVETKAVTNGSKASGRMPNWANTQDKKKFVVMSRQAGDTPTMASYRQWKNASK